VSLTGHPQLAESGKTVAVIGCADAGNTWLKISSLRVNALMQGARLCKSLSMGSLVPWSMHKPRLPAMLMGKATAALCNLGTKT
jgi:hypothetical protein